MKITVFILFLLCGTLCGDVSYKDMLTIAKHSFSCGRAHGILEIFEAQGNKDQSDKVKQIIADNCSAVDEFVGYRRP